MALHRVVVEAVRKACKASGQSEAVANRLIAWLEQAARGSAELTYNADQDTRIEDLLSVVTARSELERLLASEGGEEE